MAYHPEVQHAVAEMTLTLDGDRPAPRPDRRRTGRTASTTARTWPAKIVAAKYHCVEGAKRVVDLAMDVSGGSGHVQDATSSSACTATCAAAASTLRTRRSSTRSSARRRWGSAWASSPAGAKGWAGRARMNRRARPAAPPPGRAQPAAPLHSRRRYLSRPSLSARERIAAHSRTFRRPFARTVGSLGAGAGGAGSRCPVD